MARVRRCYDQARHGDPLQQGSATQADEKIVELLDRYKKVNLSDKSQWANTSFAFARQLKNMLELARVIAQGARLRDESRGAHYKPDFPDRNDERVPEDDQGELYRRHHRSALRV
jgi:succinate dehydrogenase/fumarate reductase flavoprotein subunit